MPIGPNIKYAQVSDSLVVNTIMLDDTDLIPDFSAGFDFFIDIDAVDPQPGPGWSYDGVNFAPPPAPAEVDPGIFYVPQSPANWVAPAPSVVGEAIDRLAEVVSVNGTTPIP